MKASVASYAARELVSTKDDGCGIDCRFYKLSDTVGLKVYIAKNKALKSFIIQKQLHRIGFGPDCWGISKIKFGKRTLYAFFTEVAEVMEDRLERQGKIDKGNWWSGRQLEMGRKFNAVLTPIAAKVGYVAKDMHLGNVGMLNGKLVVIDCGNWVKPEKNEKFCEKTKQWIRS